MSPIRVLLAEDHNVVREGLRLLLNAQPDIRVIGEATNGRQAVALARESCRTSRCWTSPCPIWTGCRPPA